MEKIKEKIIANKKFILTLSVCIILSFATMLIAFKKNSISNSTLDILNTNNTNSINNSISNIFEPYTQKLYYINFALTDCIDNSTIDSKNAVTILNNNISNLDNLKSQVASIVISENSQPDAIPKFLLCIESTINLYKYCSEILTYQNQLSSSEISSELLLLKETCLENYDDLSPYGITATFPNEGLSFFDNLIGYLNTLEKLNKEQLIKDTKHNEFLKNITTATTDLSNILEDLEPAITRIRIDNRSLDVILDDLDSKESAFQDIKKKFSYSSVPEDCTSYYNSLSNVFKLYSTYLSTMKIAVIYEKSSSNYETNKKNIDKNYSNAYSKFEDVQTSLDVLIESL